MKSSKEDLRKRGYVESDDLTPYLHLSTNQLLNMLKSEENCKTYYCSYVIKCK